jgi:hypothetical protein
MLLDICDKNREKYDYTRSISKKTQRGLDWFRPSRGVITIRLVSLYYVVGRFDCPG